MKKINLLAALFLCAFGASVLYGVSLKDTATSTNLGDGAVSDSSSTTVRNKTSNTASSTSNVAKVTAQKNGSTTSDGATLPNGTAYVGVDSTLSIRADANWGEVVGQLVNNQQVTITGREGDWYKITSSSGDGYVHSRYIFAAKDQKYEGNDVYAPASSGSSSTTGSGVNYSVSGDSVQAKVVAAAEYLVETYSTSGSFPYAAATQGGNLGCAQVVSTALVAAGVIPNTDLSCYGVMSMLSSAGWEKVSAPPFQAGDCIFWSTYDSDGDGQKDPNTHIGLIMDSGNSVQAMSNSSSEHRPRYHDPNYAPITTVMRKVS